MADFFLLANRTAWKGAFWLDRKNDFARRGSLLDQQINRASVIDISEMTRWESRRRTRETLWPKRVCDRPDQLAPVAMGRDGEHIEHRWKIESNDFMAPNRSLTKWKPFSRTVKRFDRVIISRFNKPELYIGTEIDGPAWHIGGESAPWERGRRNEKKHRDKVVP